MWHGRVARGRPMQGEEVGGWGKCERHACTHGAASCQAGQRTSTAVAGGVVRAEPPLATHPARAARAKECGHCSCYAFPYENTGLRGPPRCLYFSSPKARTARAPPVGSSNLVVEKVNKPCWSKMANSRCTLGEGVGAAKRASSPPPYATGSQHEGVKLLNNGLVNTEAGNKRIRLDGG